MEGTRSVAVLGVVLSVGAEAARVVALHAVAAREARSHGLDPPVRHLAPPPSTTNATDFMRQHWAWALLSRLEREASYVAGGRVEDDLAVGLEEAHEAHNAEEGLGELAHEHFMLARLQVRREHVDL